MARYSGEAIDRNENAARTSHYRIKISSNLYLDAACRHHFEGRYINDGKRAGKKVNVRFAAGYKTNICSTTGYRWIKIFATRDIKAGEELYLDYGEDFWQLQFSKTPITTPQSQNASPTPLQQTQTHISNPQLSISLSPIKHTSIRLQRAPPIPNTPSTQPPPFGTPTTSPMRILGHHNPDTNPQHTTQQHTHPQSNTTILNDSPNINVYTYTHTHTCNPHTYTPL